MISREKIIVEHKIREQIRKIIFLSERDMLNSKINTLKEELDLRGTLRDLIFEAATSDPDKTPHPSTGINVLEKLLKNIIPTVEDDYKVITTDSQQRQSYRAHIIHAIKNTLAPISVNDDAETGPEGLDEQESVDINIEDERFIDIDKDKKEKEEPKDPKEDFASGVSGFDDDHTGRDIAYETFQKIENQIVDAYSKLGNEQDQETFYDYLITNVKLYLDKFETELTGNLEEPTTPEYEQEKDSMDVEPTGLEDEMPENPEEI